MSLSGLSAQQIKHLAVSSGSAYKDISKQDDVACFNELLASTCNSGFTKILLISNKLHKMKSVTLLLFSYEYDKISSFIKCENINYLIYYYE